MSQQLSALRQQLLQTGETEEVAAVLLPRMIELLFTPPEWATPEPAVSMAPSRHIMESLVLHSNASARFLEILQQQKPPPSANLVAALLRAAAAILVGSDNSVSHIWLDMLLEAIDAVPVESVQSEILPVAVRQSQASNNTWARISACHLFGKVCLRLDPLELQSEVIPGLVALCQDVAWEVRSAACDQLAHAASCFRSSPLLLSTLCELGADDSEAVLVSVIGATASSLRSLTPDTLVSAVTPLLMRLAREAAKEGSPVLIALATHYGDLCLGLKGYMSPEERRWMVDMFQNMVRMGLQRIGDTMFKHLNIMLNDHNMVRWTQQVRSLAAASLPTVSQFLISEDRRDILLGIIRDLVFDPHPPVRCSLASGLHKVAVVLGVENCGLLKYDFTRLLCDQNLDVLRALMPSVAPILLFMKEGKIFSPDDMGINNVSSCTETLKALLTCEATVGASLDWRLYVDVTEQYEVLPQCMPSDIIYDVVISLLQKRILSVRQLPSRCALSKAVLKLLRFNERPEHRDDIRNKLVENMMKNKNSYHRMCYLRLCHIAMEIFSAAYFKTWFFNHVISLTEDCVATVRQVAANSLPSMKKLCKLPEDKNLLDAVDLAVNRLLEDSDREVQSVAKSVHNKLKEIEIGKATDEVDLIEKQRLEEEIAVEQREPPESWLQSVSFLSSMMNNDKTRDLQPLLKMSVPMPVSSQTISTINDLLLATQDISLTQSRTNQFAQTTSSAEADSGSTGSGRVLQGQDFVIDAGIHISGKQTTHIPSPRRGLSRQGQQQNRRSWAGSSTPKSRGQTDHGSPLQGTSDIDLLDTGQSDNGQVISNQGATGGANYQQNPLLQNVKPTGIARGVIHTATNKDRTGTSKVPLGKPGRASSSLLGSPVIMRSNRGRGNRDTAQRNSVAAIPVRTENLQPSGKQGDEDGKASVVRRRSGQFSVGKTTGGSRGTKYTLKRNSAIEMHLENSRDREHFTGRRSATFEGIPTYQSAKSVTHVQRSSPKMMAKDQEKLSSSSIPSPNITVQRKENDETRNAESNLKVTARETKVSYEKEMMPAGKLDTNKRPFTKVSICSNAVPNFAGNKHENYVEENLSLVINESKVQFDETKECNVSEKTEKNTAGESNETAVIIGSSMEKGDGEKAVHNNIFPGKVEARNVRHARNSDGSQFSYISALDKQGSKNKMSNNSSIHKGISEKKAMSNLQLREASRSPENPADNGNAVSKGVIKNKILAGNQLDDLGGRQHIIHNMIDEIPFNTGRKTPVKEEFLNELGANLSPVVNRESETTTAKNDRRDISTDKNGETVKQISRRSFNLDNYDALRPSQDMALLLNSSPLCERRTSSTVGSIQRRISSNRHSFGAVLATSLPPRRHSSLDRLGGPRSDLHEEGLGPRSGSCRSSPTSGLPASKLPILRRQHPP